MVSTSFLSLDLLTIAQILGISNGKTWGTNEYDTDIYAFMKELRSQNEQLISKVGEIGATLNKTIEDMTLIKEDIENKMKGMVDIRKKF